MSLCYKHGGLLVAPVEGWLDVTDQIEADDPPFTLTKPEGVGAIQFSVATFEAGRDPNITVKQLRELLADFALSRELGRGFDHIESESTLSVCAGSFGYGTNFLRTWYCSDGKNVALVTYVCEKGLENSELSDCERMVADLKFQKIS
jgi:hypothetical protein